jgi:hypothetical protein
MKMLTLLLVLFPFSAFANGTHYDWRGTNCAEITPYGYVVRYVNEAYCPSAHYDWRGANCAEITPYGYVVRYVNPAYCN